MIDIEQILQTAEAKIQAQDRASRASEPQTLRGGNSGCITPEGDVVGKCHRITLLRYLGIEEDKSDSVQMFAGGRLSEHYWKTLLDVVAADFSLTEVRCDVKGAIEWSFTDGAGKEYVVSGTPDIELYTDGKLVLGVEQKNISSTYRANRIAIADQPASDALIQAAHYSLKRGKAPWVVSYSSYSNFDTYYAYVKQGRPKKITPGRWHFPMRWVDDTVEYQSPKTGAWIKTTITGYGIENYFKLVAEMIRTQSLGPRPSNKHVSGQGEDFAHCTSCVFAEYCDAYEGNYEIWTTKIREVF